MRIELFSRRSLLGRKSWYFRVRATNGEIVAQSEGYRNRSDARTTAQRLREGVSEAAIHCGDGGMV